ncbi:MAG: hypothetical protein HYZ42_06335, partial [Bacteroidetes bacterium]|nr:hypothetical protein [Bacteroidota bacterium]
TTPLPVYRDLAVNFSPLQGAKTKDIALVTFNDFVKMHVIIESVIDNSTNLPLSLSGFYKNFEIESAIKIKRYYVHDLNDIAVTNKPDYTSNNLLISFTKSTLGGAQDVKVEWHTQGSNFSDFLRPYRFELEYIHVDNYSNVFLNPGQSQMSDEEIFFNFEHNSTRILLEENSYIISNIWESGYILARVRIIRPDIQDPTLDRYSNWTHEVDGEVSVAGYTIYSGPNGNGSARNAFHCDCGGVYLIPSEYKLAEQLNWQIQTAFAEEGKKKEVVSYFDGSLHNRQSITRMSTDHIAIVGQTIYDFQGRPAIQTLPVPALTTNGYSNSLTYIPLFNKTTSVANKAFSWEDFDKDAQLPLACQPSVAEMMATVSGSSQYYSVNNTQKYGAQAYLPDASGYPYAQTEYMPDHTGRIRRQGGVGIDHQLGGGHDTKYYYEKARQDELDVLFGSEVGKDSHYKKNTVIDPNGQASISYLDLHGRVIATALAGKSPVNVNSISVNQQQLTDIHNLSLNNVSESTIPGVNISGLKVQENVVLADDGYMVLDYRLPDVYFGKTCSLQQNLTLCFHCAYEYEIRVLNKECNNAEVFYYKGNIGALNLSCSTNVINYDIINDPNFNLSSNSQLSLLYVYALQSCSRLFIY